jgi:electron transfer flavoprotein alpha subunit
MTTEEIWILAEHDANRVQPVTFQLITKARAIAAGRRVVVVLLEGTQEHFAEQISPYGPDEIIRVGADLLARPADSTAADALMQLMAKRQPTAMLFAATAQGRSIAPRLQAKLGTGLTADCLDLRFDGDDLVAVKPSYGDNVMCEITCPQHRPQMVSVRPNTFAAEKNEAVSSTITVATLDLHAPKGIVIENEQVAVSSASGITGASKVIALGRGAQSDEIVARTRKLAARLGASVGVSRPLTDRADFTVEQQIGQSGNTIAPDFLLNIGISGATQYLVGIDQAKLIVSVNRDAAAPIMAQSDYTYTGDADAFLKALAQRLGVK